MKSLRHTLVGILVALIAAVVWTACVMFAPLAAEMIRSWFSSDRAFVAASSIGSGSILLAAIAGFGIGFWWDRRRSSRRVPH